uniref:Uncharacterized protein n=1 Tax=Plectus sambesii TaxID=2011161 RepID=A0A914WV75_9BILA
MRRVATLFALCSVLSMSCVHARSFPNSHFNSNSERDVILRRLIHQTKRMNDAEPSQMWSFSPYDFYTRLFIQGEDNPHVPAHSELLGYKKKRNGGILNGGEPAYSRHTPINAFIIPE